MLMILLTHLFFWLERPGPGRKDYLYYWLLVISDTAVLSGATWLVSYIVLDTYF